MAEYGIEDGLLNVVKALYEASAKVRANASRKNQINPTKQQQAQQHQQTASHSRGFVGDITINKAATNALTTAHRDYNYKTTVKILHSNMYDQVTESGEHAAAVTTTVLGTPKKSPNRCKRHRIDAKLVHGIDDDEAVGIGCGEAGILGRNNRRMFNETADTLRMGNREPEMITPSLANNYCDNTVTKMPSGTGDNCIDIEHINLERNYKNRHKTIGVQTCNLAPYRLRFWPLGASKNLKCIDAGFREIVKCSLKTLSQWFLSQVGLTIILLIWALLGAAAFYKTEGPRELEQAEELEKLQKELSIELSTDLRQVSGHEDVWPKTIEKYMKQHEELLLEAVSAGYGEGGGGSIWTYPGCILFAVSLLTTLGFGAPVPRTALARGTAVLFSAIGIPLHFLLILNIGNLVAGLLQNLATIKQNSDVPEASPTIRVWLKWFPLIAIMTYYAMGVALFGFVRKRSVVDSLMFPLDFTATGGVAKTAGHVRILYALYLEVAVTLAATVVSLLQASATRGVVDLGLRLGLLTNT